MKQAKGSIVESWWKILMTIHEAWNWFNESIYEIVKLEFYPMAYDEMETIVSIDRAAEFKKWMNN